MSGPRTTYLGTLARNIVSYLPGYGVAAFSETSFRLVGAEGRGIIFWAGVVNVNDVLATRLEVSGIYDLNAYIRNEDKPRITMTVGKGAEAMAKDVQRRFLPKYEAIYAEALKTHKEIEEREAERERLMANLAEAFEWREIRDTDSYLVRLQEKGQIKEIDSGYCSYKDTYRGKLNARLMSSLQADAKDCPRRWEVDIELKSLTVAQALRIAGVLSEPAFPSEQLSLL